MKRQHSVYAAMPDDVKKDDVWKSGKLLRQTIVIVLKDKLDRAIIASEANNNYGPGWVEWQSDNKGYRRSIRELIKLLED